MSVDVGMRNVLEIYGTTGTLVLRATDVFPQVSVYRALDDPLFRGWSTPNIEPDESEPHDYTGWAPHVHHYKREVASYLSRVAAGSASIRS